MSAETAKQPSPVCEHDVAIQQVPVHHPALPSRRQLCATHSASSSRRRSGATLECARGGVAAAAGQQLLGQSLTPLQAQAK